MATEDELADPMLVSMFSEAERDAMYLLLTEVCIGGDENSHGYVRVLSFEYGQPVGTVSCPDCDGTGWWSYDYANPARPCNPCKTKGLVYVGLL